VGVNFSVPAASVGGAGGLRLKRGTVTGLPLPLAEGNGVSGCSALAFVVPPVDLHRS